jgi:hypothetical protein
MWRRGDLASAVVAPRLALHQRERAIAQADRVLLLHRPHPAAQLAPQPHRLAPAPALVQLRIRHHAGVFSGLERGHVAHARSSGFSFCAVVVKPSASLQCAPRATRRARTCGCRCVWPSGASPSDLGQCAAVFFAVEYPMPTRHAKVRVDITISASAASRMWRVSLRPRSMICGIAPPTCENVALRARRPAVCVVSFWVCGAAIGIHRGPRGGLRRPKARSQSGVATVTHPFQVHGDSLVGVAVSGAYRLPARSKIRSS